MTDPSRSPKGRILLLDDDRALREMAAEYLRSVGHDVDEVATLEQARARVRARRYDLVLTDLVLERGTGLDLLQEIRRDGIASEVIIMTGHGGVDAAVEAIRHGAYDFITKPLSLTRLSLDVAKALEKQRLEQDLKRLESARLAGFGGLLGASAAMRPVFALLERAAWSDSDVLLLGESGTGKEVAARAVHDNSSRRAGPFVPVHCGALSPELLESELFGHSRGAFTGADRGRKGLFLAADGGTLFLDEIGTAPVRVQVGLLRVLQERQVRPVGAEQGVAIDVRIVAATNADLEEAMADGRFRQDLYYRLATLVIRIPPLRERREDIPLLVGPLLERLARRVGRRPTLAPRALERLAAYDWPGNVRELAHVLEQAALMAKGPLIGERDLPLPRLAPKEPFATLEEVEREHIRRVLEACAGNKGKAARILGVPRATLYRKIERYQLEPAAPEPPPPVGDAALPPVTGVPLGTDD
ncbi:MAG: sigma-54-dependent Fis family transcriptional regulator [Acidobacteria bacterium]|nr:sigma-54-dependent Fis family transcriptional regulator [Acidobacteriota bacterium]